MANMFLKGDQSYYRYLSTDTKSTDLPDGSIALEVDSATWFILHSGTWYPQ